MLLEIANERPRVVWLLGELLDELLESLFLRLEALHPDDQIAKRQQVAAQPGGVIAGIGGIDLELTHGRKLRLEPRGDGDHRRVVRREPAGSVEGINLELDVVQPRQRVLQWVRQVLVSG